MELALRAARARLWLTEQAWPLWAERGFARERGGFHESLDHHDASCTLAYRRLRVLARQIYVFATAARHGFSQGGELLDLALMRLHQQRGEDGLYPWRFDLAHDPIDQTRDLYDHAFVLLALSAAAPVVGVSAMRPLAVDLALRLQTRFRHTLGGFVEALPFSAESVRRQNPHMHLLEAALAAHQAFAEPIFADLARELGELFLDRLYQHREGVLGEFFAQDLSPLLPLTVEPGHHYEWVWLLDRLVPLMAHPEPLRDAADTLYAFATRHGICPFRRVVRDQLDGHGQVVADTARLWPQTERLKAELVHGHAARIAEADDVLAAFLAHGRDGLWAERMDRAGNFSNEAAPASSLYHVTCALTALIDAAAAGGDMRT